MTIAASIPIARAQRNLAPLCVAAATFLLLLVSGDSLLHDPDTLWQIKVGAVDPRSSRGALDRLLFVDAPG